MLRDLSYGVLSAGCFFHHFSGILVTNGPSCQKRLRQTLYGLYCWSFSYLNMGAMQPLRQNSRSVFEIKFDYLCLLLSIKRLPDWQSVRAMQHNFHEPRFPLALKFGMLRAHFSLYPRFKCGTFLLGHPVSDFNKIAYYPSCFAWEESQKAEPP